MMDLTLTSSPLLSAPSVDDTDMAMNNAGLINSCDRRATLSGEPPTRSGSSRAKRVTPAVMNAMAFSYQIHFEAFCKGK